MEQSTYTRLPESSPPIRRAIEYNYLAAVDWLSDARNADATKVGNLEVYQKNFKKHFGDLFFETRSEIQDFENITITTSIGIKRNLGRMILLYLKNRKNSKYLEHGEWLFSEFSGLLYAHKILSSSARNQK